MHNEQPGTMETIFWKVFAIKQKFRYLENPQHYYTSARRAYEGVNQI